MVTVLLADDHNVVRNGLKLLLENEEDINVIGEASNGKEAIEKIKELQPDIVLLDVRMPVLDGIETLSELSKNSAKTRSLVLSMYAQEDYVLQSARSGASGYILKDASKDELITAIRTIHAGNKYFSGSVSNIIVEGYLHNLQSQKIFQNSHQLTKAEKNVLNLVVQGLSNAEIANKLNISVRTVETHRFKIMKKMGVNKSKDMIQKAHKEGWTQA
ncbi:two-component system response regulator DegU [Catalinimonas alkaloidigena]|uniref:response regulator transcription factor n=1 Tax=Catalinimonas alkaloidigena TaxID=1075417 RepID=UPI00240494AD|nr:response regulator transcription factor [Catalinimonas alkaloidigena]MDF9797977.1 two-component system response regulator DegU [Catalinimonas alkaloidigena]